MTFGLIPMSNLNLRQPMLIAYIRFHFIVSLKICLPNAGHGLSILTGTELKFNYLARRFDSLSQRTKDVSINRYKVNNYLLTMTVIWFLFRGTFPYKTLIENDVCLK